MPSLHLSNPSETLTEIPFDGQEPDIQKATGETDPVKVMATLREMKNNFK